jgi:hypothetical protein
MGGEQLSQHPLVAELQEARLREAEQDTVEAGEEVDSIIRAINERLLYPPVAGAAEVGHELGIHPNNVHKLVQHGKLMPPVRSLAMGRLWDLERVREWKERRDRRGRDN